MNQPRNLTTTTFCHLRLRHSAIPYHSYMVFAEWLGVHHYRLPANRSVIPELGILLAIHFNGNLTDAWHRYYNCEHFSLEIQKEIAQWINEYNNFQLSLNISDHGKFAKLNEVN